MPGTLCRSHARYKPVTATLDLNQNPKNMKYRSDTIDQVRRWAAALLAACLLLPLASLAQTYSIVGSGTASNGSSGYPAPMGNYYYGARHQFFITAAELTTAGVAPASNIESIGFNVTNLNGTDPLTGWNVKVYTTTAANPLTAWVSTGQVGSSTPVTLTPVVGWNQTALTAPFLWNGSDNLVIETCLNNTDWSNNAATQWTATLSGATFSRWYRADAAGVCGNAGQTGTSTTTRPNVRIGWQGGSACAGTPAPGNTTGPANICASVNFSLGLQTPTVGSGVTYQWESSPDGSTWSAIPGATNATYTASQSATTWYQCLVSCTNSGSSAYSTPLQVGMSNFLSCYCIPAMTYGCQYDYISNVTVAGINRSSTCDNLSGANGYSNFSSPTGALVAGSPNNAYSVTTDGDTEGGAMWIDWNQDGQFTADEQIFSAYLGTYPSVYSGTFTVPVNAMPGWTKIRVRATYQATAPGGAACASHTYGETEDYLVEITVPACMSPVALLNGITTDEAYLSWIDNGAVSYNWELRDDGGAPGTPGALQSGNVTSGTPSIHLSPLTSNTPYVVHVQAVCALETSDWAATPFRSLCGTFTLPYSENFNSTTIGAFPDCMARETNSGGAWVTANNISGQSSPAAVVYYNETQAKDVWFFSAGLEMEGGSTYRLSYTVQTGDAIWGTEKLEVKYGTSPSSAGMSTMVFDHGAFNSATPSTNSVDFTAPSTGTYFIGFHAYSDANVDFILVDDVLVINLLSCNTLPDPGATTGPSAACENSSFTLGVENSTIDLGISYQWEVSTDGSTWANAPDVSTDATYTTSQTAATWYRCQVTCAGNGTAASTPLEVGMGNSCQCGPYCATSNFGDGACITGVSIGSLSSTTAACVPSPGYTWKSETTSLTKGNTYSLTVNTNSDVYGTSIVSVWFDWNNDGTFDATEWTQVYTSAITGSVNITVPMTAVEDVIRMRVRSRGAGNTNGAGDACTSMGSGTTEDFCVTVLMAAPCAGTPDPGNTTGPASACLSANFTLGLQNFNLGTGITYQWESSPDGSTWSAIPGATDATYIANQTATTWYRCVVTCTNSSETANSTPLEVGMGNIGMCGTYCIPSMSTGCSFPDMITNVTMAGINRTSTCDNTSGSNGYSFFTTPMGSLNAGSTGNSYSVSIDGDVEGAAAWIDYNQDGQFTGDELVFSSLNSTTPFTYTGTFNVSATALGGITRMRVRCMYNYEILDTDACTAASFGETEDYLVEITPAPPCAGTPDPGNTTGPASICANAGFTLGLQNNMAFTGLTFQWESSPDGNTWSTISGATNPTYTTSQAAVTWYRCVVTCTNSSETANSTPLQVGLNPGLSCYCETPLYSMNASNNMCTYYNYVGNFTFAGINNTTVCDNTPPYYNYYTGQTATVEQSGSYLVSISATASGASFQLYKVYIDFNDNGSFDDAGEMVYTSGFISTATNLSTGNIVIPLNAPLGAHRLRVRSTNPLNSNIDANSCSEDGYLGEVEDYDIVINAAPACSGTPAPGATLSSKALACASTTIGLSLQNAIPGIGVTYQWEASADELFTSPTSLGTASTESTTQAATTWYRCLVTCDGNTAASTPVVVYYTENCYCTTPTTGSNGCALGLYINNVTFAGINNTSGCFSPVPYTYPYYSFFPAQEANVQQMGTYAFSASAPNNGNGYYHWYGVWIDFNDNGSFDDPGELVLASNAGASTVDNQLTGNITIPITAPAGQHIMRVRTGNVQVPINSCTDNSVSGETEDYLVNITAAPACAGTPAPGNTLASSPTACGDTNIGLSIANDPLETGYSYQWQVSTDGASGPWTNVGTDANTYSTTQSVTTWYQCVVTCANGGASAASNPVQVTQNAPSACYCTPAITSNVEPICNVTFVGINNTVSGATSPPPTNAVLDFTSMVANVSPGSSYPISLTGNSDGNYTNYFTAFFDWDRNGTFETVVPIGSFTGSNCGTVVSGTINVPLTAQGGSSHMRIIKNYNSSPTDPCGSYSFGQVHDYTVMVEVSNQTCATAMAVTCGQSYGGYTVNIPHSMPSGACPFNGAASTGGQNWWTYTATGNDAVTFSTCGNAGFDTRISVFSGADCDNLTCMAMNDDSPGCNAGSSEVSINTTTGSTYWIAVHGAGAAEGSYQLYVSCGAVCAAPSNDACAGTTALANNLRDGSNTPATYTNACATVDGPTACSGAMPVSGVWFSFSTDDYGHALVTLLDHSDDPQYTATSLDYAVYSGACSGLGATAEVACATDANGFNVLNLTPNTNYLLLVYNNGSAGVSGTFGLMLEHAAHNDASIAALLSPAPGLLCGSTMAPEVTLLNNGDNDLTSVQINYGLSGGPVHTYNWTGNLAYGQSANVTLPSVPTVSGVGQTLAVSTSLPNGVADDMPANDSQSIIVDAGGEPVVLKVQTDNDASFFYWEIYDQAFSMVATGGYYPLPNNLYSETLCLSTDNGNCYSLALYDDNGDGLCCSNGNGFWELRTVSGRLLLRDLFDGSIDGFSSPSGSTQTPSYGSGHNFCLPAGPANIMAYECGVFTNGMYDKVYSNKVTGATQYQFEFSNPDAGYMRRIARPHNYVVFYEMVSSPLVPGVVYFTRARTNEQGPLASAHWGSGCDLGLGIAQVVQCTQLIQAPAYGHSCNETRSFTAPYNYLYARPVTGATTYTFKITGDDGNYNSGIEFVRSTYILALGWGTAEAPALTDQTTYQVQVRVTVNGIEGAYCGNVCNVVIDNNPGLGGQVLPTLGNANLWPNPVRDGLVNMDLQGLQGADQRISVDIQDIYGQQVFAKEFGNSGERFSTILQLPKDIAAGVYMVNITVNGQRSVQRLSIIK